MLGMVIAGVYHDRLSCRILRKWQSPNLYVSIDETSDGILVAAVEMYIRDGCLLLH